MAGLSFLIALLLGGAAFLFKQAADEISVGTQWAGDVCSTVPMFCHHPELKDAQIMRLVGTTKTTIASVRDRTHWNASTLTPMDPVTLGLCSQIELDFEVQRAAKEKPVPAAYGGATLLPASETTRKEPEFEPTEKQRDDLNVDAVFAKLKTIGGKKPEQE